MKDPVKGGRLGRRTGKQVDKAPNNLNKQEADALCAALRECQSADKAHQLVEAAVAHLQERIRVNYEAMSESMWDDEQKHMAAVARAETVVYVEVMLTNACLSVDGYATLAALDKFQLAHKNEAVCAIRAVRDDIDMLYQFRSADVAFIRSQEQY